MATGTQNASEAAFQPMEAERGPNAADPIIPPAFWKKATIAIPKPILAGSFASSGTLENVPVAQQAEKTLKAMTNTHTNAMLLPKPKVSRTAAPNRLPTIKPLWILNLSDTMPEIGPRKRTRMLVMLEMVDENHHAPRHDPAKE